MTTPSDAQQFIGRTAVDPEGSKVGKISQVYLDDATGEPIWVTVTTGLFGTRESFAPLYGAGFDGEDVRLAVTKDQVKDAPGVDADEHLGGDEEQSLYQYYAGHLGTGEGGPAASGADPAGSGTTGQDGYETANQTGYETAGTDAAGAAGYETAGAAGYETGASGRGAAGGTDDAMTRSEERLHVGTETREAGRVRLRKYVVTENVTQTVPVSHEEVRVEREPITDANRDAALAGEPIGEAEHEVVLRAERPVVEKEAVPVERVRLGTETVTEDAEVNETLRKEQIDTPETVEEAGQRPSADR